MHMLTNSIGIDMTYALLKHIYGAEKINPMMNTIEYAPHTDAHWDPFSVVHNVSILTQNAVDLAKAFT